MTGSVNQLQTMCAVPVIPPTDFSLSQRGASSPGAGIQSRKPQNLPLHKGTLRVWQAAEFLKLSAQKDI